MIAHLMHQSINTENLIKNISLLSSKDNQEIQNKQTNRVRYYRQRIHSQRKERIDNLKEQLKTAKPQGCISAFRSVFKVFDLLLKPLSMATASQLNLELGNILEKLQKAKAQGFKLDLQKSGTKIQHILKQTQDLLHEDLERMESHEKLSSEQQIRIMEILEAIHRSYENSQNIDYLFKKEILMKISTLNHLQKINIPELLALERKNYSENKKGLLEIQKSKKKAQDKAFEEQIKEMQKQKANLWKSAIFGFILDVFSKVVQVSNILIPGVGTALSQGMELLHNFNPFSAKAQQNEINTKKMAYETQKQNRAYQINQQRLSTLKEHRIQITNHLEKAKEDMERGQEAILQV